jgi:hypothetical protein
MSAVRRSVGIGRILTRYLKPDLKSKRRTKSSGRVSRDRLPRMTDRDRLLVAHDADRSTGSGYVRGLECDVSWLERCSPCQVLECASSSKIQRSLGKELRETAPMGATAFEWRHRVAKLQGVARDLSSLV